MRDYSTYTVERLALLFWGQPGERAAIENHLKTLREEEIKNFYEITERSEIVNIQRHILKVGKDAIRTSSEKLKEAKEKRFYDFVYFRQSLHLLLKAASSDEVDLRQAIQEQTAKLFEKMEALAKDYQNAVSREFNEKLAKEFPDFPAKEFIRTLGGESSGTEEKFDMEKYIASLTNLRYSISYIDSLQSKTVAEILTLIYQPEPLVKDIEGNLADEGEERNGNPTGKPTQKVLALYHLYKELGGYEKPFAKGNIREEISKLMPIYKSEFNFSRIPSPNNFYNMYSSFLKKSRRVTFENSGNIKAVLPLLTKFPASLKIATGEFKEAELSKPLT